MSQQIEMFDGNEPTLESLTYEELQKHYSALVRVFPRSDLSRSHLIKAILDPSSEQQRLTGHSEEENIEETYKKHFGIYPYLLSPEEINHAIKNPTYHSQLLQERRREEDRDDIQGNYPPYWNRNTKKNT